MRWPFGPPRLTLKPSKKKQKNKKKQRKKKQEKKKPPKKTAKTPKNSFSVISHIFLFWVVFQSFPFLTPWPRKRAPKKHYKNRGFRAFFLESRCASRNGHCWTKKPKFTNFSYHFFLPIFFSFNNKKPQTLLKPLFYSVLANLKKEIFQKNYLKH